MKEQLFTAGIWTVALGMITLIMRQIGPWRKQISDAEERLRTELTQSLKEEREAHTADLERERLARAAEARQFALERDEMGDRIAKLEAILKRRDKIRDAERSIERHRFNNLDACFNALLLLLKANPDRVPEAVAMIEDMRAKQLMEEAAEKAIIHAAEIDSTGGDGA